MRKIKLFEDYSEEEQAKRRDEEFAEEFREELTKLQSDFEVQFKGIDYDKRMEQRTFNFTLDGMSLTIDQNWRYDGTPNKPVTVLNWNDGDDIELGRYPVLEPAEYAKDIFDLIMKQHTERNYN